jgi:hypothetical protein
MSSCFYRVCYFPVLGCLIHNLFVEFRLLFVLLEMGKWCTLFYVLKIQNLREVWDMAVGVLSRRLRRWSSSLTIALKARNNMRNDQNKQQRITKPPTTTETTTTTTQK